MRHHMKKPILFQENYRNSKPRENTKSKFENLFQTGCSRKGSFKCCLILCAG
jgi:hypothetical protein